MCFYKMVDNCFLKRRSTPTNLIVVVTKFILAGASTVIFFTAIICWY